MADRTRCVDEDWSENFRLRHYELDSSGRLSILYLCRLFQESAALQAETVGIANELLRSKGLTWVLSHFHVRIVDLIRWPGWKDQVTIQTWRADIERIFAIRDYRMKDAQGNVLALGTSSWSIFDIRTRRPVSVPSFVADGFPKNSKRALISSRERLKIHQAEFQKTFVAGPTNIDENEHVNNISYITWALETIPDQLTRTARLKELKLLFRSESLLGDEILSVAEKKLSSSQEELSLVHQIVRPKDQKEICQAQTIWTTT